MSRVRIEIGDLVFHGLDAEAAGAAGKAFAAELERLVMQRGIHRPAPPPRPPSRPTPVDLGRAAAARVHARIAK